MSARTSAGRSLLMVLDQIPNLHATHTNVAEIEQEAVSTYRAALRDEIARLPEPTLGLKGGVNRAAVLALVDETDFG